MQRTRFVMIGGFLGAGKTTAIARLARHLANSGHRVGIVTNDQAFNLVDTQSLRAEGFDVGEVMGACFCCKFDDLVETAARLSAEQQPDVILAEPVGSCTDLVATVAEPLRHLYGEQYDLAPFAVLLKPEHGRKILGGEGSGFSSKAAYIFLKQIEEADLVVINKVDKLSAEERDELLGLVGERFPDKEVLAISARDGTGFDGLIAALERVEPIRRRTPEVDYDIYAEGEAELGWLNCTVSLSARDGAKRFRLDDLLLMLVNTLRGTCLAASAEPAHMKVLGEVRGEAGVANLVGSGVEAELSRASGIETDAATLTVNARVAIAPEELTRLVEDAVTTVADAHGLTAELTNLQSFRPGRPVPTHRMTIG